MTDATKDLYRQTLDCVHCGLCLPACPTYRELGAETDSPRGRIYLMRALAEGRIEDTSVVRTHLDRCLDCRACETACPSGVRYGQILETVRGDLERKEPSRGLRQRIARFLLRHVLIHQRRLRAAFALLRTVEALGLRTLARWLRLLPASVDAIAPRVPPAALRAPLRTGLHTPHGAARYRLVGLGYGKHRAAKAVLVARRGLSRGPGFLKSQPEHHPPRPARFPTSGRCKGALPSQDELVPSNRWRMRIYWALAWLTRAAAASCVLAAEACSKNAARIAPSTGVLGALCANFCGSW